MPWGLISILWGVTVIVRVDLEVGAVHPATGGPQAEEEVIQHH